MVIKLRGSDPNEPMVDVDAKWIKSKILNKSQAFDPVYDNVVNVMKGLLGVDVDASIEEPKSKRRKYNWYVLCGHFFVMLCFVLVHVKLSIFYLTHSMHCFVLN